MIVCVCRRVSDRDILREVRAGLGFDDIQFALGVATQCGRCEGCARDLVTQGSVSHPMAALRHEGVDTARPTAHTVVGDRRLHESRAWA